MKMQGKKNRYTCPKCGWSIVTVDRDEGVTPMFIRCEGKQCDAGTFPAAASSCYRVDQALVPSHEWYRPTEEQLLERLAEGRAAAPAEATPEDFAAHESRLRRHIEHGGLLIRQLPTPAPKDCTHEQFHAAVKVNRILDVGKFVAEITVVCGICAEPFRFVGIPAGLDYARPMVSIDGLTLHAPIEPELEKKLHAGATFVVTRPPTKH